MAAEVGLEGYVKHLDEDRADIVAQPLLKNVYEELAVLFAADGAVGDEVAVLGIEQALAAGLVAPSLVGDIDGLGAGPLNDGDELYPCRLQLIAEEAIDRAAVMFVGGVDRAQDIEVDSVLAEEAPALHHFVEGASLAAVEPVRVMDLAWAVDAQADQKIMLLEKSAPLIIEKDAVGLKGVFDGLLGSAVLFDQFDGAPEELNLHQ